MAGGAVAKGEMNGKFIVHFHHEPFGGNGHDDCSLGTESY
jgi:hypothetical protein